MDQKFYICKRCGNIIAKVKDVGVPVVCCGEPMSEIVPGTTDAAVEKHVLSGRWKTASSMSRSAPWSTPCCRALHRMGISPDQAGQSAELHPGEKPEVCFALCEGDEVEAVYAYCNLHSLWKA